MYKLLSFCLIYFQKYNVRDVKTWCIHEIENTQEETLLCMLKGENNDQFQATVSQQEVTEKLNPPSPKEPIKSEAVVESIENNAAIIDKSIDVVTDTEMVHGTMEMKSDPELFQEIIKSPDQNDIDELLKEEIPCETHALPPTNGKLSLLNERHLLLALHKFLKYFNAIIQLYTFC